MNNILLIAKALMVVFIAVAPFVNVTGIAWLDKVPIKVAVMLVILAICFVDFQLALLATIAFLIVIISLNAVTIKRATGLGAPPSKTIDGYTDYPTNMSAMAATSFASRYTMDLQPMEVAKANQAAISQHSALEASKNIVCDNAKSRNDIDRDLLDHYVDDKIKPYDLYIKMLTSNDKLASAQGDLQRER